MPVRRRLRQAPLGKVELPEHLSGDEAPPRTCLKSHFSSTLAGDARGLEGNSPRARRMGSPTGRFFIQHKAFCQGVVDFLLWRRRTPL